MLALWCSQCLHQILADTGPPLYAIADLQGDISQARATLRLAGVLDSKGGEGASWIGGQAQVVQMGDLVDRGPNSLDCVRLFEEIKVISLGQ